ASAALAIASVLPENDKLEQRTILVVVGVTTLSTLAMLFYPLVISMLNFGDVDAGIFLGATIHDVAQVVGAGYTISQDAGDVATIVKLLRVLSLVPVVLLVSLVFNRGVAGSKGSAKTVPWFLGGFCVVVVLNSIGVISDEVRVLLSQLSYWCLVCAVAALGIRTALEELSKVGPKPVLVLATQSIVLAALVGILL
ncbi:MAG: YeiH family protein, partial [Woeseiales bacterium]